MFPNPAWPYLRLFDDDQMIVGMDEARASVSHGDINYLLRDEFTTAQLAPLTSPRTAEPGPGTETLTQVDGQFSIASGLLTFPAQATPVWGDQSLRDTIQRALTPGRACVMQINNSANTNGFMVGFWPTTTLNINPDLGFYVSITTITARTSAYSASLPATFSLNTNYVAIVIQELTGGYLFVYGGSFTVPTLVWRFTNTPSVNLYAGFSNNDCVGTSDFLRLTDLGGAFASDYGIATLHQTTGLTSGTNYSGDADGIHDLTFSLPGSPAAGNIIELRFNVTDASNYNTAYIKRNVGNTAWDFNLDTVAAGTPTNRINVTGVGNPTAIRVIGNGSLRDCYTLESGTWTKRGSQSNVSNQNTSTLTNVTFTAGQFTPTALDSFPRLSSAYNVLSAI